jgi:hypothetical protein
MKENTGQFWFQKDREQHFEEEVPWTFWVKEIDQDGKTHTPAL